VRKKSDAFPRVQEENINYGFRRNLYALKPIALAVLGLAIALAVVSSLADGVHWPVALSGSATLLLMLAWLFLVRPEWVWQAGEKYAERLLETLEDISLL
jgi:hypothetical protein